MRKGFGIAVRSKLSWAGLGVVLSCAVALTLDGVLPPPLGKGMEYSVEVLDSTGGRLRLCLSGGAGLKPEVKEFLHRHGLLVIEGYGLTEASPTLTFNRAG